MNAESSPGNSDTPASETPGGIRLGIVGLGNMGSGHARGILNGAVPGMELAAVCSTVPAELEAFAQLPGWSDADDMFREAALDAVLIATPHYSHVPLGIAALKQGLHVLIEKPLGVHKAEAEELIEAHTRPEQVFAVMLNQRTDPRYRWVKERIGDGSLGRVRRVQWTITNWFRTEAYYRNGSWRATWAGEGGGVLLNQCPHQLDLWQWLFGMPSRVHAFCGFGRFHDIEVEDDVTAYMAYPDGMTGVFITTTGEAPGTERLEIAAENGRVVIEGNTVRFDRNAVPVTEFLQTSESLFGAPPVTTETHTFEDRGEQHRGILKNFAAAIRGEETLIAPGAEGLHSVELANSMLFSGITGEAMELPMDGAAYAARLRALIRESTHRKKADPAPTA